MSVYGTIGVGFSNWLTKKKDLITQQEVGRSGVPGNWTTEIVIPAGIGAYYSFGDKINLGLEWTLRAVNSDKLDATVGGFRYDMYSLFSVNVTYNFNKRSQKGLSTAIAGQKKGATPVQFRPPLRDPLEKPWFNPPPRDLVKPASVPQTAKDSLIHDSTLVNSPDSTDASHRVDDIAITDGYGSSENPAAIDPDQLAPIVPGITYRVQIFAFRSDHFPADTIRKKFNITQPVYKEFSEGWYRYTVGTFKTLQSASGMMATFRNLNGIPDAFVARYKDGIRYPVRIKKKYVK